MRIAIGSDHRGFHLKQSVIKLVADLNHSYEDFGCYSTEPVDYPDIAQKVAEAVAGSGFDRGILVCGTGIGMCIAANKLRGIRAARCHNAFSASRARQHNDANILCLAAEGDEEQLSGIVNAFLTGEFEGGRHQPRLDKIKNLEGKYS